MTAYADVITNTACDLNLPGVQPWGPGWFLIAANKRVESGPYEDERAALDAAFWMEDNGYGVHPLPWTPRHSATGLIIGSRSRRKEDMVKP